MTKKTNQSKTIADQVLTTINADKEKKGQETPSIADQCKKAKREQLIKQQNEKIINANEDQSNKIDETALNDIRVKSKKDQDKIIDLAYKSERASFELKNAAYMFVIKYLLPVKLRVKDYFTFFEDRIIERFTAKKFEDLADGVTDNELNKDQLIRSLRRIMINQELQVFKKLGLDENGHKPTDGATRTPDQQRGADDTPAIKAKNVLNETSYNDLEEAFYMLKKERQIKLIGLFFKQLSENERERLLWDLVADSDNITIDIKPS